MSRLKFSPFERTKMRGWCLGAVTCQPACGDVDASKRARCYACGKLVAITPRGRYAHHKPAPQTKGPR